MEEAFSKDINAILAKKISTMDGADEKFTAGWGPIEKAVFAAIKRHISTLSQSGKIVDFSTDNLTQVNELNRVISKAMRASGYHAKVADYLRDFETVKKYNIQVNASANAIPVKKLEKLLNPVQKEMVDQTLDGLLGSGIDKGFKDPMRNGIVKNIIGGTTVTQLTDWVEAYCVSNEERMGTLKRYAGQVAQDALSQFDGAVNDRILTEYKLNAVRYVGSIIDDSRPQCIRWVGMEILLLDDLDKEITWAYNNGSGMIPGTNRANFCTVRGGYRCRHTALPFKMTKSQKEEFEALRKAQKDQEAGVMTPEQEKVFKSVERDKSLKGPEAELQERVIRKFAIQGDQLAAQYIKENGNVINTDEARKLFIEEGYNGTNASAVHEASSVVGKKALAKLLEDGKNDRVSFYAGGAGSGKTSTIENLLPGIKRSSDAIIDGNFASLGKAIKQIDTYLGQNKDVEVAYVYRDPLDAWEGVIKRMLNNKSEMGRAVKSSTFLDNTTGSYKTAAALSKSAYLENAKFKLHIFDNSLGMGNAARMDPEKFKNITYPEDLLERMKKITDLYLKEGKITRAQYEVLIQ